MGAYFDTIVTPELRIGRGAGSGPDQTVPRPWDRIHWINTGAATIVLNTLTGCRGTNIDNCVADIFPAGGGAVPNGDGVVDIDDLLAVISGWGECAAVGACCISDVCHLDFTAAQCSAAGGAFYAGTNPMGDGAFETCRLPANNCDSNPLPPCYDPCKFPTDTCIADFLPEERGDRSVNIDELLAVIGAWGPCPGVAPPPGGVDDMPHDLQECIDLCNGAQDFGACLDKCLLLLCQQGLTQYCDP